MLGYTWIQWLFFFFFYSFFGWCFESTYVSLHEKRFVNRGFIRGPFLPLYGTGALMMLIVSMPFQDNLILTYVAGCVGATMVVTVIFAADFALSFKAALDLRDVLVRMEQAKDELEKMQRRLDVILAVSEENWENRKKEWNQSLESTRAGFVQRRDELVSGIEKRFERAKELLPSGRLNVNREELFDLRSKFGVILQRPELASFLKDFTKRDMLRGNPSMVSKKFSEALEELKKSAVEYKKREKK